MSDPENLDPETVERRRLEGLARAGQLTPDLLRHLDTLNGHPPAGDADVARTAAYRAAALKESTPQGGTRGPQSGQESGPGLV